MERLILGYIDGAKCYIFGVIFVFVMVIALRCKMFIYNGSFEM
jgi:hypothetical protein